MTLYFAMIYFSHYVLKLDINVGYRCFIIVFDILDYNLIGCAFLITKIVGCSKVLIICEMRNEK